MSGILQHRDVPKGSVHTVVNWEFATVAELDAYTTVTQRDVGKIAKVVDTGAGNTGYYVLDALDMTTGWRTWLSIFGGSDGGSGSTNLGIASINANTIALTSSTGTGVTLPAATITTAGLATSTQITKLNGIQVNATNNSSDATLLNRTNHTGMQSASTINDLNEYTQDIVGAMCVAGTNITITYSDVLGTLTFDVTGGGGGGATNLSVGTVTSTTVTINSDTGTDATVPAATTTDAGLMTAAMVVKHNGIATNATANDTDANLKNRANHTGSQLASTITDFLEASQDAMNATFVAGSNMTITYDDVGNTITFASAGGGGGGSTNLTTSLAATTVTINSDTGTDAVIPAADATNAGAMTNAMFTKLSGIANSATANSADATLLARANHTGTQASTTISDFNEAVEDLIGTKVVAGTNVTVSYNDTTGETTVSASGGGGGSYTAGVGIDITSSVISLDNDSFFPNTPPLITPALDLPYALQPRLNRIKAMLWSAQGNGTGITLVGLAGMSVTGTATARTVLTSSAFTRFHRLAYVSAAGVASSAASRVNADVVTVGNGSGLGGFYASYIFGCSDAATVSGARQFVGMRVAGAPSNVEPATITNCIGVGNGDSDTNLYIYYGGSAAQTPVDLGANFPANTLSTDMYELVLYSSPNDDDTIWYRVTRLNTGHVAEGTLTGTAGTVIPSVKLSPAMVWRSNNNTALAVGIDIVQIYIELQL